MSTTSRLGWADALLLIAGYLALDWMSFFHPLHGPYITPWNPAPALGLVFVLRYGWKAALPPLALAVLLAEIWVHSLPAALPASIAIAVLVALGYGAIGEHSRAAERRVGDVFRSFRHLAVVGNCRRRYPGDQPPFRARPGRAGMGAGQRLARGGWPLLDR
jgi:hypothetical protein